jgi:hypothetical protein
VSQSAEVATDQQQTLGVMSGSASTNLPLGGSGSTSGISLEGGRAAHLKDSTKSRVVPKSDT